MRRWVALAAFLFEARAAAGDVTLGVRGDGGELQIAVRESDGLAWKTLCTTPCTTKGPSAGMYRIGGFDVQASRAIALPNDLDVVELKARVTTTHDHRMGTQMTIAGLVVTGVGATGLLVGLWWSVALFTSHCATALGPCEAYDATGAGVSAAAGGIVAAIGALLLASGLETRGPSKLVVLARTLDVTRETRAWPRAQSFPMFGLTF